MSSNENQTKVYVINGFRNGTKSIKLLVVLALIAGFQGYAITSVSAQSSDQPCTGGFPCAKICGDHTCKAGEVYPPKPVPVNTQNATASSTHPPVVPTMTQNSTGANMTMSNATMTMSNSTTHSNATNPNMPTMSQNSTNANMTIKATTSLSTSTPTGNSTSSTSTTPKTLSPNAQVASGIQSSNVKCSAGHSLVLNSFNSRPACIKSEDLTKFIARGWGQPAA